MIHPKFKNLLQETIGVQSIQNGIPNSHFTLFLQNGINRKYEEVDELNAEITKLKQQHMDEVLELKLKLSNIIDINYNLLQELRKQDASKTN